MDNSIVLINPPSPWLIDDKTSMPLGILYIASYIRNKLNHPVKFIDLAGENNEDIPKGYKYYGITATTPQWPIVRELIAQIKEENPDSIIIAGGPHPSALPNECIKDGCDYVVLGEGEKSIEKILKEGSNEPILKSERIADLDILPFPARKLVRGYKKDTIICSRGCPFECKYCCSKNMWNRIVKMRSVANIMNEVDEMIEKNKVDFFMVQDETFGLDKKWLDEFCKEIFKRNIKWGIQTRARLCSLDFLLKIKNAGCIEISLGIESGSKKILHIYSKDTKEVNLEAIGNIAQAGMSCRGFFIVGLPGETEKTITETEKFIIKAKRLGLNRAILGPFVPYPGCELYKRYKDKGNDFSKWYHYSSAEYGYGNTIVENAKQIMKWKNRLQNTLGEINEYLRYEKLKEKI